MKHFQRLKKYLTGIHQMTKKAKVTKTKKAVPPELNPAYYDENGQRFIADLKPFDFAQAVKGNKRIITRAGQLIEGIYKLKDDKSKINILVIRPNGETYLVNEKGTVGEFASDDDLFHPVIKQLVHVHIKTAKNSEGVHSTGCKATYNCSKDSEWHGENATQCVAVEIEL